MYVAACRGKLMFYDFGLSVNQIHKFLTCARFLKNACKIGSGCNRILFLYSSHLHAQMLRFDNNHYPHRIERVLNTLFYLCGHTFLYLQSTGINFYYACYFAQTGNFFVGDIGNMRFSEKRKQMMFAKRIKSISLTITI